MWIIKFNWPIMFAIRSLNIRADKMILIKQESKHLDVWKYSFYPIQYFMRGWKLLLALKDNELILNKIVCDKMYQNVTKNKYIFGNLFKGLLDTILVEN